MVIGEGGVESTQGVDQSVTFSDGTATGELVHLLVSTTVKVDCTQLIT